VSGRPCLVDGLGPFIAGVNVRRKEIALFYVVIAPYVLRHSFCLASRSSFCFRRANISGTEGARTASDCNSASSFIARFLRRLQKRRQAL
jgi:hypothetical protein